MYHSSSVEVRGEFTEARLSFPHVQDPTPVLRLAGNALPYMLSHLAGPDVVDCAGIPASPFARGFNQTPVRAFPSRGPTVPVYSTAVNINR